MAKFTANPARFDPYKNFKFRVGTAPGGFDDYAALRSYTPWVW